MAWLRKTRSMPAAATTRSLIGQLALGHYELLQLIGEGSNGEVYLARSREYPAEYVVVKRMKPQLLDSPRFRQFFESEVHSMARFNHPYIVQLYDASVDDPIGPCLVMEFVRGETLETLLEKYPRWHPERMASIVGQLCHALQAAHDAGIMHRDLKPANIMVTAFNTPAESVKVMDFGFAGFTDRPHVSLADLTDDADVSALGTPAYVSPEMVRGDSVDHRADLYAVGVILFEMLAGRLPFDFPTVSKIVLAHAKQPAPRFAKLNIADVPAKVEAVVQCAMSKFASERYPTARELARHFGQAIGRDLWLDSAPSDQAFVSPGQQTLATDVVEKTMVDVPAPSAEVDQFAFHDRFEALLPPKLAAMKIKGFVEEVGGTVIDSEPGHIQISIGLPGNGPTKTTRSGVIGWLTSMRGGRGVRPGEEPIEIHLRLQNLDSNRVAVAAAYRPYPEYLPDDADEWQARCEQLHNILRMYLIAR
jgi:eukaryotic-like serine/threonine-protein kinase